MLLRIRPAKVQFQNPIPAPDAHRHVVMNQIRIRSKPTLVLFSLLYIKKNDLPELVTIFNFYCYFGWFGALGPDEIDRK